MFEKLGRFEIKGILGRGAMGEVYLGIDPSIGREVAIKTILASAAQGEEAKLRFAREARAAGVLNHPNIVTIYEFGEDQGVLFIAMERVKGQDLEEMLRHRSLAPAEALEVLAQVCDGLEFAHRNGIIHRDIKPSNVRVLRDGRRLHAKVMDFGVARLKDSEMTATGTVVGTVSYMAPEYIRTGKPDARSDLFAVGVMLYECISGRKPFEGDTTATILYRIVNEPPEPIDLSLLKDISPAIRCVLDQALAKEPAHRYQTADQFAHALRAAKDPFWQGHVPEPTVRLQENTQGKRAPDPSHAAATVAITSRVPRASRARITWVIGAVAVLGLAGGGYLAYSHQGTGASKAKPGSDSTPKATQTATPAAAIHRSDAETQTPRQPPIPRSEPKTPHPDKPSAVEASSPKDKTDAYGAMPQAERKNAGNISFSEAIAVADTNPNRALEGLRSAMAANPGNSNAYAWSIAILYEQGRYQEIPGLLAKARQNGVGVAQMMSNARFRMAMQNDKLNHRIPGGVGGNE